MPCLTWEQFSGWKQYHNEDPWGESRADSRQLVNIVWSKAPVAWPEESWPEFTHPYLSPNDPENILSEAEQVKAMKEKILSGQTLDGKKPKSRVKKDPDTL